MDTGGIIYDIKGQTSSVIPGTEGKTVRDIALDRERDNYYYQLDDGLYNSNGEAVVMYSKITDVYSHGDDLFIGEDTGIIHRYDMKNNIMLDDITVPDQVNKMLYSEEEQILFVACEVSGETCQD